MELISSSFSEEIIKIETAALASMAICNSLDIGSRHRLASRHDRLEAESQDQSKDLD